MKTQIIALEAHDDFISVRDRMSWAKSPRILLVWPKFEKITLRAADLRILQQHAAYLGAEMGIITRRGDVRRDAERFGIPVFGSAAAAQRQVWLPRSRLPSPWRGPHRKRAELQAMREGAGIGEAHWRSRPLARIGFFALAVLAVLAIAGVFVPEADIRLQPVSQEQSITLPITASTSTKSISLTGSVPSYEMTVSVAVSQSARVSTQSSVPNTKAHGVARFTNLSQSDLTIPAGTIIYSLSPAAVQFATLNDTHLPGNVNAIVEVPIAATKGGADANLPANAIQAIEGNLSLSAAVTNPEPTDGGTDRVTAAPSDADRARLHDVVAGLLKTQAQSQISALIGKRDLLIANTLRMGQVAEESYDPPAGQPGYLLKLSMRADFTAEIVKGDDLDQLAEATLNAAKPEGFAPVADTMSFKLTGTPTADNTGAVHFNLQLARRLSRQIDLAQASALVRGHSPQQAEQALQAAFPLAGPSQVLLRPAWWPWLPLVPFRVTMISAP
jgi:baseplate J-like protein